MSELDRNEKLSLALNDLLGFAERNLKRAQAAHTDAKTRIYKLESDRRFNVAIQEAREHEAQRFYFVVRERIAEALR